MPTKFVNDYLHYKLLSISITGKYFRPRWEDPIIVNLRKGSNKTYRMFSVPPPASGAVLGFILNLLDEFNLTKADFQNDTLLTTHQRIIETFKHAYAFRTQLGDQNFVDVKDVSVFDLL